MMPIYCVEYISNLSIGELFFSIAHRHADKMAIIDPTSHTQMNYLELLCAAQSVATTLQTISPGMCI